MPPFREGPIKVDRKISGEMLHFLREVGHGHRINIVDASYDIPQDSVVIDFPGSTAEAFEAIARLIPIENEKLGPIEFTEMIYDESFCSTLDMQDDYDTHVVQLAAKSLHEVIGRLNTEEVGKCKDGTHAGWDNHDVRRRLDKEERESPLGQDEGFYSLANNPDQPHTFIRTQDDLPFACVSLVVGHSQRTE